MVITIAPVRKATRRPCIYKLRECLICAFPFVEADECSFCTRGVAALTRLQVEEDPSSVAVLRVLNRSRAPGPLILAGLVRHRGVVETSPLGVFHAVLSDVLGAIGLYPAQLLRAEVGRQSRVSVGVGVGAEIHCLSGNTAKRGERDCFEHLIFIINCLIWARPFKTF